jgi:hypothetical protein
MAKQEDNTGQNSLNLVLLEFNLTTKREFQYGQGAMPTLQSANAVERQTENIHL